MSPTGPAAPRGLWINPAVGVAGDMLLAALLDAGADPDTVRGLLGSLDIRDWTLDSGPTTRRGITATAVKVSAPDGDRHRSWSTIDAMLADADLPGPVRDGTRATFHRLARAEADVHDIAIDEVHFHEVGAVDAIIDVVGAWAALFDLGMPTVTSAPVGLGVGMAPMAHGTMAVPAPATLELLRGFPTVPVDATAETATPTGAALLTTMAAGWGPLPAGTISSVGRGAGAWDPATHANVVTVVRFDPLDRTLASDDGDGLGGDGLGGDGLGGDDGLDATVVGSVIIETTVDDVTPEVLGHLLDRALGAGADDAWVLPVTMKKSRPGHQVRILCRPTLAAAMRRLVASETGTLGLREWQIVKHELARACDEVTVGGHLVRIKTGPFGAKPEHDDVVAAAAALGRPARDIAAEALSRLITR